MTRTPSDKRPERQSRRFSSGKRKQLALGGIAAAGLSLSGCSDEVPSDYEFKTVQECLAEGFSEYVCEEEYKQAQLLNQENAPRFGNENSCETDWGEDNCRPYYHRTRTHYSPFLTGYLVSSALRNVRGYDDYHSYRTSNPAYNPTPLYRDRTGRAVTINPSSKAVTPVNVSSRTTSRGGFGGRSSGRSSFGG